MTERMVPVEVLEDCIREAGYVENFGLIHRLRALLNGPGVEPVAPADVVEDLATWIETQRNDIPATGAEFAAAIRKCYLPKSPSAPAQAASEALSDLRELIKEAS